MGFLASKLEELLKKHDLIPAEIARRTGLEQSLLSRVLNGTTTHLRTESYAQLAKCFPAEDHAALQAARLLDLKEGPGSSAVKILIDSGTGELSVAWESDKGLEAAISELKLIAKGDSALRRMILDLRDFAVSAASRKAQREAALPHPSGSPIERVAGGA